MVFLGGEKNEEKAQLSLFQIGQRNSIDRGEVPVIRVHSTESRNCVLFSNEP